jgi:hypothetical protein
VYRIGGAAAALPQRAESGAETKKRDGETWRNRMLASALSGDNNGGERIEEGDKQIRGEGRKG